MRRPRMRWLVGFAGAAALSATLLGLNSGSAGAVVDPVAATFGVTGVATSNCKVSVGGTDVYVRPGQELDVKTSIVGLTLLGLPLDLSKLASLNGALVIDPQADQPTKLDITNKVQKLTLPAGNHKWTWTVNTVKIGALPVPLGLTSNALKLGAKLTWDGTIHVTTDAADCGLGVQLPSISASVSVTGLPPIAIGIPGVKVTLPVNVPTVGVPTLGKPGDGNGGSSGSNGGNDGSSTPPDQDNPIPVPAKVVPGINGGGLLGGGIEFGGIPAGPVGGGSDPLGGGAAPAGNPGATTAARLPDQTSSGKHKTIDLAASRPASTGEVWVVLAIIAVIALAFVAATYARLYLMKREG
ncbi:MAG: hypothetical protein QOH89_2970 [Pseudonocardiales bacterium]|nr:hypothetical protein [Pseudonocardiales bacterium]MDT4941399.1 hypothetical protein [Pseudonocardiales bacterium]